MDEMELPEVDLEAAIEACVEEFYARAFADPMFARMFHEAIPNIPDHLRIVCDFWSHALLGTGRYPGSPYPAHTHLAIEPEHFERWLGHFRDAAERTLPEEYASTAIRKAEHMMRGMRSGLYPFVANDSVDTQTAS